MKINEVKDELDNSLSINRELSSFRDDSGFIFKKEGLFYRSVSNKFKKDFDFFIQSGLCNELTAKGYLISHVEVHNGLKNLEAYKILLPSQLSFLSYPFEWSFSMLKDAALLTLKTQKIALEFGMTLKDASAYNVQFVGSQAIFIDTLSFEKYEDSKPWQAYGQFCRHFLAPLALMSKVDVSFNKLLVTHLDGVHLALASKLLPFKTKFNVGLYLHLHLHAKTQVTNQDKKIDATKNKISKKSVENVIENLTSTIAALNYTSEGTEWGEYYNKDVEKAYFENKSEIVAQFLQRIKPTNVLDLGANDGAFSRLAANFAENVYSFDIDPSCVENNYLSLKKEKNTKITPVLFDMANPSPGIGWMNLERSRLWDRVKVDTIMALALIHHLCISNNLPFNYLSEFFAKQCNFLIIEWVPKEDEKVQRLLQNREDIFDKYNFMNFLENFSQFFELVTREELTTKRILLLFKNREEKSRTL